MNKKNSLSKTSSLETATASHYDDHPFEFMTEADEREIEVVQRPAFRAFVDEYLHQGDFVGEIGCGPGKQTLFLATKGVNLCAIDLSFKSLKLASARVENNYFVQGTNLKLPFKDGCFDAVVSDGVIHHTPDPLQSLKENARVLKEGGFMYLGVYRRYRYYYYIYTYLGVPVRWLDKRSWGCVVVYSTLLPLYYLVHLIKTRGRRTWKGARNFFYDYIITPRASFHSREEVQTWADELGLELQKYEPNVGNVHAFTFRKANDLQGVNGR